MYLTLRTESVIDIGVVKNTLYTEGMTFKFVDNDGKCSNMPISFEFRQGEYFTESVVKVNGMVYTRYYEGERGRGAKSSLLVALNKTLTPCPARYTGTAADIATYLQYAGDEFSVTKFVVHLNGRVYTRRDGRPNDNGVPVLSFFYPT